MSQADQEPASFPLAATDCYILSQTDDHFQPHTWDEVKDIIAQNRLDLLKRRPSDLRRYMKWSTEIKAQYGNVPNYIMRERLHWTPISNSSESGPIFACESRIPFQDAKDFKIMPNDWPYGWAPGITHLIVWLKTRLEVEPQKGDLTAESRALLETFVHETFIKPIESLPGPDDRVQWFKNWVALQSVPGLEHFHVLVRDVPKDIVLDWTNGERMQQ